MNRTKKPQTNEANILKNKFQNSKTSDSLIFLHLDRLAF